MFFQKVRMPIKILASSMRQAHNAVSRLDIRDRNGSITCSSPCHRFIVSTCNLNACHIRVVLNGSMGEYG